MDSSINLDLTACRCISATRWPQTVSSETGEKERISFKPAAVWTVSAQMVDACSVPASAELISHFFSLHATAAQCASGECRQSTGCENWRNTLAANAWMDFDAVFTVTHLSASSE